MIATNIPSSPSFSAFDSMRLDLVGLCDTWSYRTWSHVEDISFWLSLLTGVAALLFGAGPPRNQQPAPVPVIPPRMPLESAPAATSSELNPQTSSAHCATKLGPVQGSGEWQEGGASVV
jgi:hypothetical protein